jgi:hypothetical protein
MITAIRARAGFAAFCLLSMAMSYALIGNIFMLIGTNMAERLLYLPSAFFLMWIATLLAKLPRTLRIVIVVILVSLASIRTVTYAARWNNRFEFYLQAHAEQPRSIQLLLLVAEEYEEHGDLKTADSVLERGCAQFPRNTKVWTERGRVAMEDGRLVDAERYLKKGLDIAVTYDEFVLRSQLDEVEKAAATRSITPSTDVTH